MAGVGIGYAVGVGLARGGGLDCSPALACVEEEVGLARSRLAVAHDDHARAAAAAMPDTGPAAAATATSVGRPGRPITRRVAPCTTTAVGDAARVRIVCTTATTTCVSDSGARYVLGDSHAALPAGRPCARGSLPASSSAA